MDDLDGIPRGGHEPDSLKALWKIIKKIAADISVLQRAAPQRSMSLTDGGDLTIQNGGKVTVLDNGSMDLTGQGIDGFTNEKIVSRMSFGNREAVHSWTGLTFLQPGVYLEGETQGDILDTPRLTGVINRDGLMTRSGRRPSEGRPANIMEQSSALCTPWSASMGTIRYDSLINVDGEDGLAGREFDSSFSTIPGVANGMVEDVLNQRAYYLNLSADAAMATSGKTGAVLAMSSWHASAASGWIRVDDGGLIDIQATVGAKTVAITSEVAGKLELMATDGVNVQGPLTVNGAPIGTTIVDLPATATDLNDYTTNGLWHQSANAGAAAGLNYPLAVAGLLEVVTRGAMVYQSYTTYSDASGATMGSRVYVRGKYNSTWRAWKLLADQTLATAAVDGLMPKADKAKLDAATAAATANTLVMLDGSGRAKVANPSAVTDIANKQYVDAADATLQTAINGKASAAVATISTDGLMPSTDKSKLDGSTPAPTAFRLMQRDSLGRVQVADPAAPADAATMGYADGLKARFKRVLGTGLPSTLTSAAGWVSFGSTVTVPADLFGPGVPYIIKVHAQAAGFPVASAVFSLRLLFNGAQPNGAKANSPSGPHNATTTVDYDYDVTTSVAVTVTAQAQTVFGNSTIGTGADQALYTVAAFPFIAL